MSKIKFEKADPSVMDMVTKVLMKYGDKFSHLNPGMFTTIQKEAEKSTWHARIRLTAGYMRVVLDKPIILEVWKQSWQDHTDNQRALTIYHELCHVVLNEKNETLKLRRHDIQDFEEVVSKFGLHGEKIENIL